MEGPGDATRHDGFDRAHDPRVRAAVARAYEEIPFYARRRAAPRELLAGGTVPELLAAMPLLWKHDIRPTFPREWVAKGRDVRSALASGELELVETSGSTADRTRILWDRGWWLAQEERAMRTNPTVDRAMADPARYREAILTSPVCGVGACHAGDMPLEERTDKHRLFLNTRPDPTFWGAADVLRMLDELAGHETVGLESDPAYLATLARHATAAGRPIAVSDFVTLTYAMTSAAHRRTIERAVSAPTYQLYGASEVGVLFMEGVDGLLHHCPQTTHVELLPVRASTPGADGVALVVVTTLDRTAQPLVRFVVGDLVRVALGAPSRFSPVPPLVSLEGRLQDAIVRSDGAWVTAGALDRALADLPGIAIYQANQPDPRSVIVDLVPEPSALPRLASAVADRLAPLLAPLEVSVRRATAIAAEPSGKFRLARRAFGVDLGALVGEAAGVTA